MVAGTGRNGPRGRPQAVSGLGSVAATGTRPARDAARARTGPALGWGNGPAAAAPPFMRHLSLRFSAPALEGGFRRWWAASRAPLADAQGAAVYLAMVLLGAVLLLVGRRQFDPELGAGCDVLIAWSALTPASQLLLLRAVPAGWYRRHRTAVTLAYRAAYLAFTSCPGYGLGACAVGSYAWQPGAPREEGESAFSALLWRSGIIGMWWYPMAFPLLLHLHAPVQAAFFAAYAALLAPAACHNFASVRHGAAAVSWAARAMQRAKAVFFAAHGVAAAVPLVGSTGPASTGQGLVSGARAGSGGGAAAGVSCSGAVVFGQLLAGLLLPTFALWCSEARLRLEWLRAQRADAYAQRWRALAAPPSDQGAAASTALPPAPPTLGGTRHFSDPFAAAGAAAALTEPATADASLPHAGSRAYCLAGAVVVAWVVVTECVPAAGVS